MTEARKRPCIICRQWFRPDPRVGARQHTCRKPACQAARRQKTQAEWRRRNPDYGIAYRLQQRAAQPVPIEPFRMPTPLNRLPWDLAKDQFGAPGADFIGVLGNLLLGVVKDQFQAYSADFTGVPGTLPPPPGKHSSVFGHTEARASHHATGISPTRRAVGTPAGP
jgi:hypothetical protein